MCDVMIPKRKFTFWRCKTRLACRLLLGVCLLVGAVSCEDEHPPMWFSDPPVGGSPVAVGGFKMLICRASSQPAPQYTWLKDGRVIANASDSYNHRLSSLTRDSAGMYRCVASNKLGAILSAPAKVEIAYIDQFTDAAQTFSKPISEGGSLVIPLPLIDSFPDPTLTWLEGAGRRDMGSVINERHHITLNGSLVLLDREMPSSAANAVNYVVEAINGISGEIETGPTYAVTVTRMNELTKRDPAGTTLVVAFLFANRVPGLAARLPPTIVFPPEHSIVTEQSSKAEFECIFNARPIRELQISWFRVENNGTRTSIPLDPKYIISQFSRTLTIKNPDPTDNGIYECEARMPGFTDPVVASANLTVYTSPMFSGQFQPRDLNRDFGQIVTMDCQARGFPEPTVSWYYNAMEIFKDYNSSSYQLHSNNSLTISQLDLEHAGMYQCFIHNAAGEMSKSTWLKVNSSPPQMVAPPANLTVVEQAEARMTCETKGAPKPVVTWTRTTSSGAESIVESGRIRILDNGELFFLWALSADSGVYTCNSSNSMGHITASATLNVFVKTEISRPPQDKQVVLGATAVFQCGVSHDPSISVAWTWTFRSRQADQDEVIVNDNLRTVHANGTLEIRSCGSSDIGQYTCLVTSEGGNDNRSVSLGVIELPGAPVIQSVQLHQTDVRGVVVGWNPTYDGNTPILKFTIQYKETISEAGNTDDAVWVTYNSDIDAAARSTVVTGLKPARFYQFRMLATNEVGEGRASTPKPDMPIEMPQQPPSAPPKGFFGVAATNRSVRLGWQPPDESSRNGPLLGYTIKYKPANYPDSSFQQVQVINGTNLLVNPRYELFGLDFFTEYQIQIAAFNAKGTGVFSIFINVMTKEGHPTEAPKALQAIAVNSTSIQLSWLPPSPQFIHGVNLGYKVYGRRSGTIGDEFETQVNQDQSNPVGRQSTTLTNLLKYTEYSLTVLCFTTQGNGPRANPVTERTAEDVPSQVGSLVFKDIRDTSLKVEWTEPTELNGILQGYTLMYEPKNNTAARVNKSVSAAINSYTVFGLTSMTMYTVYIFASTRIGAGPMRSADIRSGVPPELPTPPIDLGYSNLEARSVLLQFYPGYDGKTSITRWIVEALEGTGATTPKTIFELSNPSATSIHVQNLRPYTYYRLRIIAENIVGPSDPSEWTSSFQTLQDAPASPPGSITVRTLNSTALRVSWTPLSTDDWNGMPRGYRLYYRQENDTDFTIEDLTNGMNMDSAILTGLQEWMVYEVKMLAYNDVGKSEFSPVRRERTRESVPSSGPVNVVADALSSTSIKVTWGDVPMLDQNGMIQGFKIEYSSAESNIPPQFLDIVGNTTRSTVIQGLRKYVEYSIRVLAYTRMGDGVLSQPPAIIRTLADVPGPPVKVWFPDVGYTFATIEWQAPEEPNGIITGYMVAYKIKGSTDDFVNSTVLSAGTLRYQVTGLDKQAYYLFRVRAKTHFDQQHNGWGATAQVEVLTMTNRSAPNSPGKPSIVQSQVKARSVTISWVPAPFNGYGPLRNFTAQYQRTGHQWTDVQDTIMPTETLYSVQGLQPNTVYVFRIAATNDVGMSPFSVQSDSQRTMEDLPEGAPQQVHVERLTRTSVKVTWEEPNPTTWNGQLLGYKISYRQVTNSDYLEEIVEVSEERSRVFSGLVKFVNYEFLLNAFNSVGPGPTSKPVTVFVGEAAPTAPPMNIRATTANSSEISVTWQPPPPDTQNGDLSGYKVTYWLRNASPQTAKQIIVREIGALLTGLKTYSEYAITVQAYNLAGEGPKSPAEYAKTLEGLPDAPAGITFWNVTYVSLDVHWYAPPSPNGKIINYTLTYEETSNGGTKLVTFHVPGNETKKTIPGDLIPLSLYEFSVSARTSVGEGNQTKKSVRTGPQTGSPGRPKKLRVDKNMKDQKIILTWEIENSGDTAIYSHFIQVNNTDSTRGWETILQVFGQVPTAQLSLLMLKPGTVYRLRVMSMNSNGVSPYSDPSDPFTTAAPAVEEEETPFHYQPWFLVIVGLTCVIILLIVGSLLCLISRRGKPRQKKAGPTASTTNLTPTPEPEDGGFGNFEMTRQSTNRRNNKFAGIRNGGTNSIYARPPPRPSPASVAYSEDDDGMSMAGAKPPLPDDDDDDTDSSCTDKPSQLGDSTNPSDEDSDSDMSIEPPLPPPPPPPSSPPPPPFSAIGADIRGYNPVPDPPLPSQPWQQSNHNQNNNNSSFNAYQYTDSEAESSHYAYSLNGGQILLNNTAGSRAPLPGFSSFV